MSKDTKFLKKIDKPLFFTVMALLIIGCILVFSASWPEGVYKHGNGYFFVLRHIRFIALGIIVMYFSTLLNYKFYKKVSFFLITISVILNAMLYFGIGETYLGSSRWLNLPYLPMFMPSDLLKISSVIFMAQFLSDGGNKTKDLKTTIVAALLISFFTVLVMGKDFGSSMVLFVSLATILLVSGIKISHTIVLMILAAVLVYFGLNAKAFQYRIQRLTEFLDPFDSHTKEDWQLSNSLYAFALGGLTGSGLGKGVQKFSYVPHAYNDFIFSVLGEEFGFIGTLIVVLLYFTFIWRGLIIASNCKDKFGKLLAVGITSSIAIQACFTIMVSIGLAPITGITLPFISYGGTSLLVTMFSAGILFNISINNRRKR